MRARLVSATVDVFVMHTDGTRVLNLTHHPATDRNRARSPDGTRMVFASDRGRTLQLFAKSVRARP